MYFIRNILFFISMAIVCLCYALLSPCVIFSEKLSRKITMVWLWSILFFARILCGIKTKIHNEQYKDTKGIIIASNHCSAWETFFISHYYNVPVFVLKKSLMKIPCIGLFLKKFGMIGIDRESYSKKTQGIIIQIANTTLISGRNIVIFPQGTRVPIEQSFNYKQYPYKSGVAMFSSGKRILTISTDASKCFGRGMFSWKNSGTINVIFNEILDIEPNSNKQEITDKIRHSIESGLKKIL